MVAVAIVGILSAVAVPAFIKNARKAKTSEAMVHLNRIYSSSRTYILEPHMPPGSAVARAPQFPEPEAITPTAACCITADTRCAPNGAQWSTSPTWNALMFSVEDPHYFRYAYESTGSAAPGVGSNFHAQAFGDLNCDGKLSTFELYGEWSSADHDVHGSAGFYIENPLE
jgi:type II secretory pathway pseudopilin PulG